jgi:peptidoglycan-associated lipoprotein
MATRGSFLVVTSLLVLAAIGSGCAKRPATTQAAAPAPTGTASTMAPGSSQPGGTTATPSGPSTSQPGGGATAAPTPAPGPIARPAPKDFAPVPELQDIYFDFDKYDIRPSDTRTLDANAAWLKSNPNHLLLIEGHADERGTNEYNLALGERRAKSTMNYLVSQGVQANRITIISYGEERPTCTEKTEGCWAKNRRSHFLVKPR